MTTYPDKVTDWIQLVFDWNLPLVEKALAAFSFQYHENEVYGRFVEALRIDPSTVSTLDDIPLLPIEAFRDAAIKTGKWDDPELIFESSGTTGMSRSRHEIYNAGIYQKSILEGFRVFYPEFDRGELVVLGYTPGYADNPHSSLIWMINELIQNDTSGLSRFLPLNKPLVNEEIQRIASSGKKLMLFGAAFGLLDLVEMGSPVLPEDTIVMETGGMKTYKREMSRAELHDRLSVGFGIPGRNIHSEYGMAEMLSQAYDPGEKGFETPPWLNITIRDPQNPMRALGAGEEGLIGVIDLANVYSCSFLLTGDRGVMGLNGRISVLGRWKIDNLRGCNFLIDQEV